MFLALVLPVLAFVASSCDDDDDTPQVEISFTYRNGVVAENSVYAVQPDTLVIESINVKAVREGHKAIATPPVNFWLDGVPVGTSFVAPYSIAFPTEKLALGRHALDVSMGIAEEGYALSTAVARVYINVVADEADIPSTGGGATNVQPVTYTLK